MCFLRKYLDMALTSPDVILRNLAMLFGRPGSHDLLLQIGSQGWHFFVCSCIKFACFTLTSSWKIETIWLNSSFFQTDKSQRQVAYIRYDKMAKNTCEKAFAYKQFGILLRVGFVSLYEFAHAFVLCSEIAQVVGGLTWIQRNIPMKTMYTLLDNVPR